MKEAGRVGEANEFIKFGPTAKSHIIFQDMIKRNERLGNEAISLQSCQGKECAGHAKVECYHCLLDSTKISRLQRCCICWKTRCRSCTYSGAEGANGSLAALEAMGKCGDYAVSVKKELILPHWIELAAENIGLATPDTYICCTECRSIYCYACLEGVSAWNLATCFLTDISSGNNDSEFRCGHCYWSTKPCTNPKCPNEAGTPTKRCGGCHLDRYCSVECQAEMYPGHVAKCQKIQAKRVAKDEKKKEWSDWIGS